MLAALLTAQRSPQASPAAPPDTNVAAARVSSPDSPLAASASPPARLEAPLVLAPTSARGTSDAHALSLAVPPVSLLAAFVPARPSVESGPPSPPSSASSPPSTPPLPFVPRSSASSESSVPARPSASASPPSYPLALVPRAVSLESPAPVARSSPEWLGDASPPLLAPATTRTLASDPVPVAIVAPPLAILPSPATLVSTPPREDSDPPPPPPPPSGAASGGGGGGGYGRIEPIELGNPATIFFDPTAPIFAGEVFDPRANAPRRARRAALPLARFLPFGVSDRLAATVALALGPRSAAPAASAPEPVGSVGLREVAWLVTAATAFSFGWNRVGYFAGARSVQPLLERVLGAHP